MQDLNDKVTGGTLTAAEWNQVPSEIQNVIEGLGISLSAGDLNQLGKAIAGYVANGTFYLDSGAADAYVLTTIGSKQNATVYTTGFNIQFIAGNANTGASTVNVGGLGVKSLKPSVGTLGADDISAGVLVEAFFDGTDFIIIDAAISLHSLTRRYRLGAAVKTTDGSLWRSVIAANLNNDPLTDDGTKWLPGFSNPWLNKSGAFTIEAGKMYQIDGSGGTVDGALKTSYVVGDVIIVHNESISTNLVRLTNTALTIKGPGGTVTSSDNLELDPGDTAHLVAKTPTILEVV